MKKYKLKIDAIETFLKYQTMFDLSEYNYSDKINYLITNKKDLNDREKDILKKRFPVKGKGLSLDELGLLHGISRERVRQIEANAINKIVEMNQSLFNTFNEELSKLISYYGSIIPIKSNEAT